MIWLQLCAYHYVDDVVVALDAVALKEKSISVVILKNCVCNNFKRTENGIEMKQLLSYCLEIQG